MSVWTGAHIQAFFKSGHQMGLTHDQRTMLVVERLTTVDDFIDFKQEQIKKAIKNICVSIPDIPAVDLATGKFTTATIPLVLPCLVPAQCQRRLSVVSIASHYYKLIGRQQTTANMNYRNVLGDFCIEREVLESIKEEDKPKVPVYPSMLCQFVG